MNQMRIGKFISTCRKEKGLTQARLAEQLGITDRAVSKWENGRSIPDAGIMLELTEILGVSVNELLTGEKIEKEDYKEMAENNLLELKKREEVSNKALLDMEVVIGVVGTVSFLGFILLAGLADMSNLLRGISIGVGCCIFAVTMYYALKIEREAGYYECADCHHRYVPDMRVVVMAPHMGRTRKMRCPKCGNRNWHKKVLSKD